MMEMGNTNLDSSGLWAQYSSAESRFRGGKAAFKPSCVFSLSKSQGPALESDELRLKALSCNHLAPIQSELRAKLVLAQKWA